MADTNKDNSNLELSDENIVIKSDSLSGISSEWASGVSNLNIGSIDVMGTFSPLMDNGIGTGLFPSIDSSIKSLLSSVSSVASSVSNYVDNQQNVDRSGTNAAKNRTSFNSGGGTSSNYSNTTTFNETGKNGLNDNFNDAQEIHDTDEESIIDKENLEEEKTDAENEEIDSADVNVDLDPELIPIYKEIRDCVLGMDEYTQIEFINELCNISSEEELKELLYDEEYAKVLKDKLLNNITSKELISIIEDLDPSQIQKAMKELLVNGETISDFSKAVFTVFENSNEDANVSDSSSDLFKAYSSIVDDDNLQEQLSYLYDGNLDSKNSETVTSFTRNLVDTISAATNVSSSDLLSKSEYSSLISDCAKDVTKSFSYLNASFKMGSDAMNSLHSNVTIKES